MKNGLSLFFSVVFLFILVFGAFSVSALADVWPATNSSDLVLIATGSDSNGNGLGFYLSGASKYAYYEQSGSPYVIAMGTSSFTARLYLSTNGGSPVQQDTYSSNSSSSGIYQRTWSLRSWIPVDLHLSLPLTPYSDWSAACADYNNDYQGPVNPSPSSPTSFSIVVPPGYSLVIDSSQGFQAEFDAFMPSKNVLELFYTEFGSRWWPYSPVKYSVSSSSYNLAVGSTLPPSGSSYIPWLRSNVDVLGQTKQAHWSTAVLSSHFILYNPYLYLYSAPISGQHEDFNNTPVTVTITDISPGWSYTLYEMSDRVVQGLSSSSLQSTVTKVLDMNPDFYGGFVDSSGTPVSPKKGGALSTDNAQEVTLNQIVADLDNFFRGTWDHVRNLINVLSDFPAYITQLYSWLPGEYRAVIFAGFSLSMIVGVLKVLL